MIQKHNIAFLAMIMILIGIGVVWMQRVLVAEGFVVSRIKPTCTVYYTDDIGGCEMPYTENGIKIDYSYHREHYTKLKEALERQQKQKGNLSKHQARQYATVLNVLKQYDKFIDGQSCKLSVPKWKQLSDKSESVALGNIQQNTHRGNPDQWAFCISQDGDDAEGVQLQKEKDGSTYYIKRNGKQFVRGSFPDFELTTMKSFYCKETASVPSQLFSGMQIDPFANTLRVIVDGRVQEVLDDTIANAFINAKLISEIVKSKDNVEEVYMASNAFEAPIYKVNRDICGKDSIVLTNVRINVLLAAMKEPIKRVSRDQQHLLGTREDLLNRKAELTKLKTAALAERERTRPLKEVREEYLEKLKKQVSDLDLSIASLTRRINGMKKSQAGVAAASSLYVIPGIGAVAGLAMAFASIGMAARLASWRRLRSKKISERNNIQLNCSIKHMLQHCKNMQTYACTPDEQCPPNLLMMQDMYDEAKSVHQPFVDKVALYEGQIREINSWLKKMNSDIMQFLVVTIQNGDFVVRNPPYEALSHDNKFYVHLL